MGREATCRCRWGDLRGDVTVLLEPSELIVRGEIRARVALPSLTGVRVRGSDLVFAVAGEPVELALGADDAVRWWNAIAKPPPSLAQKLGIAERTRVAVIGMLDDDGLRAAAGAGVATASTAKADVVIVRIDDGAALETALGRLGARPPAAPVWVVYTKGRRAPLGEAAVRDIMRARGFRDTKVATVSATLTALRFSVPEGQALTPPRRG
jgi:hypothetical protein